MTYQLTINPKPSYLHVIVTGRNSKENVANYLMDVLQACSARSCFRVLVEERLEGPRLDMLEVFEIAAQKGSLARGKLEALAYVDVHAQSDLMKFAETVAVNRALPVAVFATVAEAERWLQKGGEDSTPLAGRS